MRKIFYTLAILFATLAATTVNAATETEDNNIPAEANVITTDGTFFSGIITASDEDWFKFTPVANTLYRVTLNGEINKDYKNMDIFQIDEFENLHKTLGFYSYSNNAEVRTFFIEKADDIYIKMYNYQGGYSFYIETLGNFPVDGHSNDHVTASAITVDATPTSATLDHDPEGTVDVDWFVFETEPLHKYQINLKKADNTDVNCQLHNAEGTLLRGGNKTHTVTSWFGEQYKIYVYGYAQYLGTYYTLEVVDLGVFPDDYNNIPETATTIPTDGTFIEGKIQYSSDIGSDEDWFKFTPVANTLYRVTLNGEIYKDYKNMDIFQIDEFDNLYKTLGFYSYSNEIQVRTFFIEKADDLYLKLYNYNGNYSFYIEAIGNFPPDSHQDNHSAASAITVDAAPTEATLNHRPDGTLDVDWFVFDTQPLHKYQINLKKADNTDVNCQLHNAEGTLLRGGNKTHTVVSWFGEQYKIYVYGYPQYLGTHYTLEVVDLGAFPDDYPNTPATAVSIPKDGTVIEGEIQYLADINDDEDWFTFTAPLAGDYQFMLNGEVNKDYKNIKIYWQDELDALNLKKEFYVYSNEVKNITVNLPAGTIYVKLFNYLGGYSFSVVSPEPRCGDLDHPYPAGDANFDCYVNLEDLAIMSANWLSCTAPECSE
ncbi:MAG: hypothetical protein JEZ07_11470 [Phycisphaerae bacterium]|nr:hypothetical protein [Phycisphaerae bacterium]